MTSLFLVSSLCLVIKISCCSLSSLCGLSPQSVIFPCLFISSPCVKFMCLNFGLSVCYFLFYFDNPLFLYALHSVLLPLCPYSRLVAAVFTAVFLCLSQSSLTLCCVLEYTSVSWHWTDMWDFIVMGFLNVILCVKSKWNHECTLKKIFMPKMLINKVIWFFFFFPNLKCKRFNIIDYH